MLSNLRYYCLNANKSLAYNFHNYLVVINLGINSVSDEQVRKQNLLPFADRINQVSTVEPWKWLAAGWADLRQTRTISITYGLIFVVLGYAVTIGLYQLEQYHLIWPFAAGFILIAPVFSVGIYELSRRLMDGEPVTFINALMAWKRAPGLIFGCGLAMTFFLIIWIRTAALIYVINFPYEMLTIQGLINQTFFSMNGLIFMSVGTLIGAFFAVTAFLLSAVSLPLMIGEKSDFLPALLISIFVVTRNPRAMMLWAIIIVVVTAFGMATALIGLAVTLPLIGHATWHAYKAVVKPLPEAPE